MHSTPWKLTFKLVDHGLTHNGCAECIVDANGDEVCRTGHHADEVFEGAKLNGRSYAYEARPHWPHFMKGEPYPHSKRGKMIVEAVNNHWEPTQ